MKKILWSTIYITQMMMAGKLYDADALDMRDQTVHAKNYQHFYYQIEAKPGFNNKDECERLLKKLEEALIALDDDINDCDNGRLQYKLCFIRKKLDEYGIRLRKQMVEFNRVLEDAIK